MKNFVENNQNKRNKFFQVQLFPKRQRVVQIQPNRHGSSKIIFE